MRRTKIQGEGYSLEAVGHFSDLEAKAIAMNEAAGVTFRYAYQPHAKYCDPAARLKAATDAQIDSWPELAAYRTPERRIMGVSLLWKKEAMETATR